MSSRRHAAGTALLDLLVGAMLGLAVLALLVPAVGSGARLLSAAGARGETEDATDLAIEALTFDVRRAGYDPQRIGVPALVEARADGFVVNADLDGDGAIDPSSEETVEYQWRSGARRLSRIVGRQSMPLGDGVTSCAFRYLDSDGIALGLPVAGLDEADRARVRAVAIDLTLVPPALIAPAARSATVALRTPG